MSAQVIFHQCDFFSFRIHLLNYMSYYLCISEAVMTVAAQLSSTLTSLRPAKGSTTIYKSATPSLAYS